MNGNNNPIIHDLDILRPGPEYVKLAGKDIDISFIPSGIAIDITQLHDELLKMTDTPAKMKKIRSDSQEAAKAFELSTELCAKITSNQHEEMTKEWLMKNTTVVQIKTLMSHITRAVFKSFENVKDDELKKPEAVKTENP